jgi:organic hydroperoxide reductase OsmC/OhrA
MLTQIVRYGRMLKVSFSKATCRVSAHWTSEGSVFAGTISSTCHAVETEIAIESDDDPARIAALVRNAEGGCYAQAALQQPVPVTSTVLVNGEPMDYRQYPRKVERPR